MKKVSLFLFMVIAALVTTYGNALALDPPESLAYNYLYHSVGKTAGVTVGEPVEQGAGKYVIDVVVKDRKKREALATLLVEYIEESEEAATIRVVDGSGNVQAPLDIDGTTEEKLEKLKNLFSDAFRQNPFFDKALTFVDSITRQAEVYPIFRERTEQFPPDDLSGHGGLRPDVVKDPFNVILRSLISEIFIIPHPRGIHGGLRTGWVIGDDENNTAVILHTGNGGRKWWGQGDNTHWAGYSGNDISAVDRYTAWAALGTPDGGSGVILHTTNGGATWVKQKLPKGVKDAIKGIKGLSRHVAWAVTLKGTILHTTNGGKTWNIVPHPSVQISQVNRMDAIGHKDVWIVDEFGGNWGMIHTVINGITWRQEYVPDVVSGGPHAISAYSPMVAWAAVWGEGYLFRTVDGGETWRNEVTVAGNDDFDDICAASAHTVWGVLNLSGASGGRIYRVRLMDGEADVDSFTPITSYLFEGMTCIDDHTALVVGYRAIGADPSLPEGVILFTNDGGQSWVNQHSPVDNVAFWKVSFVGARR
jgi:photosystem II stability/assembly factor-like uncharacterized protein